MKRLFGRLSKAARIIGNPRFRKGLRHGVAATIEHRDVLRPLSPHTLIDVGANKGQFSLLAKVMWPHIQIHAFEPLHEPAARFAQVFRDDTGVKVYPFAAGPSAGAGEINLSGRLDSSSILRILGRQSHAFPGTRSIGSREIEIRRLDEVLAVEALPRPVLIKVDVQGYELSALDGATGLLARVDHIYVEVSFVELYEHQPLAHEVIDWMKDHGFQLAAVGTVVRDFSGDIVQADMLFSAATARAKGEAARPRPALVSQA